MTNHTSPTPSFEEQLLNLLSSRPPETHFAYTKGFIEAIVRCHNQATESARYDEMVWLNDYIRGYKGHLTVEDLERVAAARLSKLHQDNQNRVD